MNNPFLGSGRAPLHHASERLQPQPQPWSPASALFVVAAGLKDIASRLPKGQEGLGSAISQAAADWEDWYCGNGPRPLPHVTETAGELLAFAGTLEASALRVWRLNSPDFVGPGRLHRVCSGCESNRLGNSAIFAA